MGAPSSSRGGSSNKGALTTAATATNGSNSNSNTKLLLSRGYTSRLLPPGSVLRHLSAEETEKDLRHFQAYHRAVISYRQQYYLAVNPNALPASNGSQLQHPPAPLPVRIDPEEEKRLTLLRRKIARAECLREDLEQQYVALRAHYVHYSQEVRQLSEQIAQRQEFLQQCTKERATNLGLMRARLQMTRDVLAALQKRGQVLEVHQETPATVTPSAEKDQLEALWNQVEEDVRKHQRKLTAKNKPMVWPNTKMPLTPFNVPSILSTTSSAPEKAVAYGANGIFGSHPKSLVWTIPELRRVEDDVDEINKQQNLEDLQEEVAFLHAELNKERRTNQDLAEHIARARSKNDEWVAMICLVRQETESVLHRHNVVLDSEAAQEASERLHLQEQDAKAQKALLVAAAPGGEESKLDDIHLSQEVDVPLTAGPGPDEDNDGDDEGSEEDHQEELQDDNDDNDTANNNKRAMEEGEVEEGEEEARKKRRKV